MSELEKQAKTAQEILRYMRCSIGEAIPIAENEKWVPLDSVEKALAEQKQKLLKILNEAKVPENHWDYPDCNCSVCIIVKAKRFLDEY